MPRIRSLKPEFCTSEAIAQLSIPCRLHFALLWTYADDAGRGVDHPKLIKAALWPLDDDISPEQVNKWQAELERKGRVTRYEVDGKRYFQITNWSEHQHPNRPVESKLPPSPHAPHTEDSLSTQGELTPVVVDGEVDVDGVGEQPLVVLTDDREPPIIQVFQAWKTATNRNGRTLLNEDRKKAIKRALKDYPLEDVLDAVRGWRHSPHHRGENDRNTVYNDLELLLRNSKQIETFRDLERGQGPAPPPKMPKSFDALKRNHERHTSDPERSDGDHRENGRGLAAGRSDGTHDRNLA